MLPPVSESGTKGRAQASRLGARVMLQKPESDHTLLHPRACTPCPPHPLSSSPAIAPQPEASSLLPGHLWAPSGLHPRAATPAGLGHPCPKTRSLPLQPCSQTLSMSPLPLPTPRPLPLDGAWSPRDMGAALLTHLCHSLTTRISAGVVVLPTVCPKGPDWGLLARRSSVYL